MSTTFSCKCFNYKVLRERALQVTLVVFEFFVDRGEDWG